MADSLNIFVIEGVEYIPQLYDYAFKDSVTGQEGIDLAATAGATGTGVVTIQNGAPFLWESVSIESSADTDLTAIQPLLVQFTDTQSNRPMSNTLITRMAYGTPQFPRPFAREVILMPGCQVNCLVQQNVLPTPTAAKVHVTLHGYWLMPNTYLTAARNASGQPVR